MACDNCGSSSVSSGLCKPCQDATDALIEDLKKK